MSFLILYGLLLSCVCLYVARMFWTQIRRDPLQGFTTRGFIAFAVAIHLTVIAFWGVVFWCLFVYQHIVVETVSPDLPYPLVLTFFAAALFPLLGAFTGMFVALQWKRLTNGILHRFRSDRTGQ